ncbi:hypothetical protein ACOSQ2_031262 [Xanthoceras sorbifolium]
MDDQGRQLDPIVVADIDVGAEHICAKTTETCDKEEPSNQGKKYKGKEVCDDSSIILLLSKGKECSEAAEMWQRHIKQDVALRKWLVLGDDNSTKEA